MEQRSGDEDVVVNQPSGQIMKIFRPRINPNENSALQQHELFFGFFDFLIFE